MKQLQARSLGLALAGLILVLPGNLAAGSGSNATSGRIEVNGTGGTHCVSHPNLLKITAGVDPILRDLRKRMGRRPLQRDPVLDQAAQQQACHVAMKGRNPKNPHLGAGGSTPKRRVKRLGYCTRLTAENLAVNFRSPASVMQAWAASQGHLKNLSNSKVREYGLGVAMHGRMPVWIMVLAKPC